MPDSACARKSSISAAGANHAALDDADAVAHRFGDFEQYAWTS